MTVHKKFPILILASAAIIALLAGCNEKGGSDAARAAPSISVQAADATRAVGSKFRTYTPQQAGGSISTCNIEFFDGQLPQSAPFDVNAADTHIISGWVAAPRLKDASFWLRFEDRAKGIYLETHVEPSIKRADVVESVAIDSMPLQNGFNQKIPPNTLPSGNFHLYLAAMEGATASLCDNGREVNVK